MSEAPRADVVRQHTDTGDELSFADIVRFLLRNRLLICLTALGFALVTAAYVLAFVGRSYEASAILVIVPPKFTSELKPQGLTVQGYQTLLESDATIAETANRLIEKRILRPKAVLKVGDGLKTRIFVGKGYNETTVFAPMIQITADGSTAEEAATIANTWAEVFVERAQNVMVGTTSATVKFIETQFPQSRTEVAKLEDERTVLAATLQQQESEAANRWDVSLAAFNRESNELLLSHEKETQDLIAAYNQGTRTEVARHQTEKDRLLDEFRVAQKLEIRRTDLAANKGTLNGLQSELSNLQPQLESKKLQIQIVRTQLEATPKYNTTRKAVTDDALWQSIANGTQSASGVRDLQKKGLVSEELNPVWLSLSSRITELDIDVNVAESRLEQLRGRLTEVSDLVSRLTTIMLQAEGGLAVLQRDRENSLAKLNDERAVGLFKLQKTRELDYANLKRDREVRFAALTRESKQEIDSLARVKESLLGRSDRELTQQREFVGQLGKTFNQATLAKAERDIEEVRLGSPAVPPDRPQPRGGFRMTLLAMFLGGAVGMAIALVRDLGRIVGS